jgi:hypothetical protein
MKTKDLLVDRSLPKITGFSSITTNIGELKNKGLDITITSTNIDKDKFNWKSTLTYSMNRNEITKLFGDKGEYVLEGQTYNGEIPDYTNEWFPGHALDAIWNYEIVGIWQEDEEEEAAEYGVEVGDFKVRNLDDSKAHEALQDKTFIGYTEPRHRLGLMNAFTICKNFHALVFLRADLGHKRSFDQSVTGWTMFDRQNSEDYPYWTPENKTNKWPKLNNNLAAFGGGIMPYKPTSFLRVQDVSFSYDLPNASKITPTLKSLSIYFSARNLLTFSDWPGYDPESGHDPMPRTYSIGVNLSF